MYDITIRSDGNLVGTITLTPIKGQKKFLAEYYAPGSQVYGRVVAYHDQQSFLDLLINSLNALRKRFDERKRLKK